MKNIKLPRTNAGTAVEKLSVGKEIIFGTTTGLVKANNEDAIGFAVQKNGVMLCMADGHWGDQASRFIVDSWLEAAAKFPATKKQAILLVEQIENGLFQRFSKPNMDESKDFTPEAAFVAIDIRRNILSIAAYGDCRLLVTNNGLITFQLKMTATWLGVFSRLTLRNRLPVNKALQFRKIKLNKGDRVILFTDGVDECVYEKPTMSLDHIAKLTLRSPSQAFDAILEEVFAHGAEDNASLAIVSSPGS